MSLTGKTVASEILKGSINFLKTLRGYSAYELAVINGFSGTEEEWLESLNGDDCSVNIRYGVSPYPYKEPMGWSEDIPNLTATNRYLWANIYIQNGSSASIQKGIIGVYSDKGPVNTVNGILPDENGNVNVPTVGWVNVVETYGIDNTGSTDVGPAVQSIIDSVDDFAILYFPTGDYLFNTGISITKKITIIGESRFIDDIPRLGGSNTRFTTKGKSNITMITAEGANYAIENILFYSDSATTIENTVEPTAGNPHFHYELVRSYENVNAFVDNSDTSSKCYFNNIMISGFSGTGIKAPRLSTLNNVIAYSCGVGIETFVDCLLHNSRCWGCEIGASVGVGTAIQNGRFEEAQKHGMVAFGSNKFTSVTIDQCGYAGLVLSNYAKDVTFIGKITRCGQYYFNTSKDAYLADENRIEEGFSLIYADTDANGSTFMLTGEIESTYSDAGTTKSGVYLLKGTLEDAHLHLKDTPNTDMIHNGIGKITVYGDKVYRFANGSLQSEDGIGLASHVYDTRLQHRGGNLYVRNNDGSDFKKLFIPERRMVIATTFDNAEQVGWSYGGTWVLKGSIKVGSDSQYELFFYEKTST